MRKNNFNLKLSKILLMNINPKITVLSNNQPQQRIKVREVNIQTMEYLFRIFLKNIQLKL